MEKNQKFFGTCTFAKPMPTPSTLRSDTKILNICLSFDDALKLNLAVQECVRKIYRYNLKSREGKNAALKLGIHFDKGKITVTEGKL